MAGATIGLTGTGWDNEAFIVDNQSRARFSRRLIAHRLISNETACFRPGVIPA